MFMLPEYACELFFYERHMQSLGKSVFVLNFFNVNIEKVLICVCHTHAHDFSTPVHSLPF